jgi:starch-binding outer membrane protein, SusD/RagB family
MKYRVYSILLLLIVIACTKFDFTASEDSQQFIDSETDLERAVTGAYSKFASLFADGLFRNSYLLEGMMADDYDLFTGWSCSGDSCTPGGCCGIMVIDDQADTVYLGSGCYRSNWDGNEYTWGKSYLDFTEDAYRVFYKAITSQNFILTKFNDLNNNNPIKNTLLGEVCFMRAYSYFRLTRLFGQIPLIIDTDVDYQVQRASFEDIYAQIESDLSNAIQFLPSSAYNARIPYVTPCRGSAKALLAEVYLTMGGYPLHDAGKYQLSAQFAKEVIDSAEFFGFGLMEDFAGLYRLNPVLNEEMVSIVQYKSFFNPDILNSPYIPKIESNDLALYYRDAYAEVKFFNNSPPCYRKDCIYNRAHAVNEHLDTITWELVSDTVYLERTTSCYQVPLKQSQLFNEDEYFNAREEYFLYILRYAHTLLTYAEASVRAGNINPMSYEALNMVRRRAQKESVTSSSIYDITESLTTEQFLDSVVWERAWECTGDPEGRWFDLLRLEMIDTLNALRDAHEAPLPYDGISKGEYFFPIPEYDIRLNPNLLKKY